jgi:acyl carrier protein|tara:strand:- start:271 stop:486 length:216 start_codon:yes stop_codon:yes gene_type:complete
MQEFYKKLSDILEIDSIEDLDTLRDFEYWDSLTVLSILAMLDSELSVSLSVEELDQCITAKDLYLMVEGKR